MQPTQRLQSQHICAHPKIIFASERRRRGKDREKSESKRIAVWIGWKVANGKENNTNQSVAEIKKHKSNVSERPTGWNVCKMMYINSALHIFPRIHTHPSIHTIAPTRTLRIKEREMFSYAYRNRPVSMNPKIFSLNLIALPSPFSFVRDSIFFDCFVCMLWKLITNQPADDKRRKRRNFGICFGNAFAQLKPLCGAKQQRFQFNDLFILKKRERECFGSSNLNTRNVWMWGWE